MTTNSTLKQIPHSSVTMSPTYPHKWTRINEEEREERGKIMKGPRSIERDMIKCGDVYMAENFAEKAEEIYNFEVKSDDVWIVTYPKCGTTWMQETVWHITHPEAIGQEKRKDKLFVRSPFLEVSCMLSGRPAPAKTEGDKLPQESQNYLLDSVKQTRDMDSPRVIKTHILFEHLPQDILEKGKVVYVCRNPKDVCISFFHHVKMMPYDYGFDGSLEQYADHFMSGKIGYGGYFAHLKSAWKRRHHPNLKIVWFEDMKSDQKRTIENLCEFLGCRLSPEKVSELENILKMDKMRENAVQASDMDREREFWAGFFRKGQVDGWKSEMGEELAAKFDRWMKDNHYEKLRST